MQYKTLRSQILLLPMPIATLPTAQPEARPSFPAGPKAHYCILQREEQSLGSAPHQDGLTAHTQDLETGVLSMHVRWRHLQASHCILDILSTRALLYNACWCKIAPRSAITQPLGTCWGRDRLFTHLVTVCRQGSPEISQSRHSQCYRN